MPLRNFDGDTFVAFIDISGFKKMMGEEGKALEALNNFYSCAYHVLEKQKCVKGLFVSDCGVLFVDDDNNLSNTCKLSKLNKLLGVIQEINVKMLKKKYMLTTSIAYGKFSYRNKIEFKGIEKNPIYGNAYINAYLDNENGNPRIKAGQCRILVNDEVESLFSGGNKTIIEKYHHLQLVKTKEAVRYYRYYWNVQSIDEIEGFEKAYKNAEESMYLDMWKALKKYLP
jgi:hypothetical protein